MNSFETNNELLIAHKKRETVVIVVFALILSIIGIYIHSKEQSNLFVFGAATFYSICLGIIIRNIKIIRGG